MRSAIDDWNDFQKRLISPAASPVQVADAQLAFFGGYWCMLLNARQIETFPHPARRAAVFDALFVEVQQFLNERHALT
jgi:hypothetical protein